LIKNPIGGSPEEKIGSSMLERRRI
jgi:hypothetical protein